jgi:hypothetical protein
MMGVGTKNGVQGSTKRCSRCAQDLPVEAFRWVEGPARGLLRSMCRDCDRDYAREYAEAHKDERRAYYYERKFGVTIAEYEAMLAAQGGRCAVCRNPEKRGRRGGGTKLLAVDHDHETGQVRGLVCHDCNTGLGMFLEDPELLERAAEYLRSCAVTKGVE